MDTRAWRVGAHYGIHGYAVNRGKSEDEPIFTAHRPETASQIVSDHSAALLGVKQREYFAELVQRHHDIVNNNKELRRQFRMLRNTIDAILSEVEDCCDDSPAEVGCE